MKKRSKKKEEWTIEEAKKELKWVESNIAFYGESVKYFENLKKVFSWKLKQLQKGH